jgi:general secretion pathway protein G
MWRVLEEFLPPAGANDMGLRRRTISDASAFSLVELVIVVVIIGIIAAIAIPRVSGASQGAREAALRADLKLLRDAIDGYAAEHGGDWPAFRPAGAGATVSSPEAFERQLLWHTTDTGDARQSPDSTHVFGPYLRKIPPLPVGANAGRSAIYSVNHFVTPGAAGADYGWEYEPYTGRIRANCTVDEVGSDSVPYCAW